MDTGSIMTASELVEYLGMPISNDLRSSITELLEALEREDFNIDCYLDEVASDARCLPAAEDYFVARYYSDYGWRKGLKFNG